MHKQTPVIGVLFPHSRSCDFLHARVCLCSCQTATLNSFRSILMDAQSQGLSLHPLDQQSWLGIVAICNLHLNVVLLPSKCLSSHPLSSHQRTPLYSHSPLFMFFVSLTPCVSRFPSPLQSPSIFILFRCFFSLTLLFHSFFSMHNVSLNNFKSQSLAFCIFVPICLFAPLFSLSFLFCLCLPRSPSLCVQAQQRLKRSPRTESVGVCEQE